MKPIDKIQRRKLQRAVTETVRSYRNLIRNPRRYARYWHNYSSSTACRFCWVVSDKPDQEMECPGCPLARYNGDRACDVPTMDRLVVALAGKHWKAISRAAENRLDWLTRRFEEAGYTVEQEKGTEADSGDEKGQS